MKRLVYTTCAGILALSCGSADAWHQFNDPGTGSAEGSYVFYHWPQFPVEIVLDAGTINGSPGVSRASSAIETWNNVPTSRFRARLDLTGKVDFTGANYGSEWGIPTDGIIELVFDEDGSCLSTLFGGTIPAGILGIGLTAGDSSSGELSDGMVIIRGGVIPDDAIESIITHELGHLWGLAHSCVGIITTDTVAGGSSNGLVPLPGENRPTMFPYYYGSFMASLEHDDRAGLSTVYPENVYDPPGRIPFGSTTGTISGVCVSTLSGAGFPSVHLRAVNLSDRSVQVGRLSDIQGDTSGAFEIGGLPPGDYLLCAEAIDGRGGITGANIEDSSSLGGNPTTGFEDEFHTAREHEVKEDIPGEPRILAVNAGKNISAADVYLPTASRYRGEMPVVVLALQAERLRYGDLLPVLYTLDYGTDPAHNFASLYVAIGTPGGKLYFVTPYSAASMRFSRTPVAFRPGMPVNPVTGIIGAFKIRPGLPSGEYTVYAVLGKPGESPLNPVNWVSRGVSWDTFTLGYISTGPLE